MRTRTTRPAKRRYVFWISTLVATLLLLAAAIVLVMVPKPMVVTVGTLEGRAVGRQSASLDDSPGVLAELVREVARDTGMSVEVSREYVSNSLVPWKNTDVSIDWFEPDRARSMLIDPAVAGADGTRLLAIDPFGLVVDRDFVGGSFDPRRVSLDDVVATPSRLIPTDGSYPEAEFALVAAGAETIGLGPLVLYLIDSQQGSEAVEALYEMLSRADRAGLGLEDELPPESPVAPVVDTLVTWTDSGALPANWLEWDRLAVIDALTAGRSVAYAMWYGQYSRLSRNETFSARFVPLPPAGGRRTRSMVARVLEAQVSGDPWDADAAERLVAGFQDEAVQRALTEQAGVVGVVGDGAVLNLEHRDLRQAYRGTGALVAYGPAFFGSELWEETVDAIRFRVRFASETR